MCTINDWNVQSCAFALILDVFKRDSHVMGVLVLAADCNFEIVAQRIGSGCKQTHVGFRIVYKVCGSDPEICNKTRQSDLSP